MFGDSMSKRRPLNAEVLEPWASSPKPITLRDDSFPHIQELVGGHVEVVHLTGQKTRVLAVNEDAGMTNEPPNRLATLLMDGTMIRGVAVLCDIKAIAGTAAKVHHKEDK